MYSALNISVRSPDPGPNRVLQQSAWSAARRAVAAALRPAPGAASLIAAWRFLFAAACFVRLGSWWRLLDDLQDSYIFIPAVGWEWLPPPSPAAARTLCTAIAVTATLLAAGILPRGASAALLLLCSYATAAAQDPGSQLDSLILQLSFANCLLPLSSCWTVGGALRWWAGRRARRQERSSDGAAPTGLSAGGKPDTSVKLWALLLLRTLLVKPYVQDALAKLADGWNWLVRAQPAAQRLLPVTRVLPVSWSLPWLISWTCCLLDCAAPPLLLHRPTRYTLGLPCVAVAQVLNYCMWGLDGWWLLLAGSLLAWAPPEAVEALGRALQAAAACALAPCRGRQPLHERWPSPQRQRQQQRELTELRVGTAASSADEAAPLLRAQAWSSWFWEGSGSSSGATAGRQRRVGPPPHQQQQQMGENPPSPQRVGGRNGHGASKDGPVQTAVLVGVLALLAAYHVLTPLRFLAYPSRPAWTEEGLIAPWHRHLSEKRGWVYFVITEAAAAAAAGGRGDRGGGGVHGGAAAGSRVGPPTRVVDAAPEGDPMLGQRSASLVATSPAAALRYAARLARVAEAAGRPIASVRALSCFSLNGGPHRTLFDATANLLLYAGAHGAAADSDGSDDSSSSTSSSSKTPAGARDGASSRGGGGSGDGSGAGAIPAAVAAAAAAAAAAASAAGGEDATLPGHAGAPRSWRLGPASGVSRWLHDYDTAPRGCDPFASPRDRPGLLRRSRADLAELQAAAGLWVEVVHDGARGGLRRSVCWDVGNDHGSARRGTSAIGSSSFDFEPGETANQPCRELAYRQQ